MEENRNFITKRELDALYDTTLWLMSEKFFGEKKNVWDDVLPAAAEILSSKDFDNNVWTLTNQWDREVYDSLPRKSGEDMSERELRKYSKENQPIVEVFKRSIKLYVLFCFFSHKETDMWDINLKSDPLDNARNRILEYIEKMANCCENLLADRSIRKEVNRCLNYLESKPIDRNFPYYDRSRLSNIIIVDLVEKKPTSTKSTKKRGEQQGLESVSNNTLLAKKDRRIEELEAQLVERDGKIKELIERLAEMDVDWDNAEDNEKTTPKTVQLFFINILLDIVVKKERVITKRDLVLLGSLLCNYDKPTSVYSHPTPWNNNFEFKTTNEKNKIFEISAVLIHGMGINDEKFKNKVMKICKKIPTEDDYVSVLSRLLPSKY